MKHYRTIAAIVIYLVLLLALAYAGRSLVSPGRAFLGTLASFALLLAPLWFFGFGAGQFVRRRVPPRLRTSLAGLLVLPYLVFALSAGQFRWSIALAILVVAMGLAALLQFSHLSQRLAWQDVVTLALLVGIHLLRLLDAAWPGRGSAALPKLLLIDILLYLYVVVRDLDGIGYSLPPTTSAVKIGLREWLIFLPIGVGLGTVLEFTRFHPHLPEVGSFVAGVVFTFLFIAIPEELFFRGVVQNLLETRLDGGAALILASVLFGLSHYHRGGTFDWRYILLATIAGVFYGRAWREHRQLLASIITHTAVDVVWSVWFR